jgi:hypothetical protein
MAIVLDVEPSAGLAAAAPRGSPLKVLLAIALGAGTVVFAFRGVELLADDSSLGDLVRFAGISYSAAIPLILHSMALLTFLAAGAVSTVALWQDGWGRPHLLGPVRTSAVWVAGLGTAALAALTVVEPQARVGGRIGWSDRVPVILAYAAFALVLALALRTRPYRDRPGRTFGLAALVTMAAVGSVLVPSAYTVHAAGAAFEAGTGPGLSSLSLPPGTLVCETQVDLRCAQRAADRAGFPVAWVPLVSSPQAAMIALPGTAPRLVRQDGYEAGSLGAVTVESSWLESGPSGPVAATLHAHGDTALVRRFETNESIPVDQILIDWFHLGRHYQLSAFTVFRTCTPEQIADLASLWTSIRYAIPR